MPDLASLSPVTCSHPIEGGVRCVRTLVSVSIESSSPFFTSYRTHCTTQLHFASEAHVLQSSSVPMPTVGTLGGPGHDRGQRSSDRGARVGSVAPA